MELKDWVVQHVKARNAVRPTLIETKHAGEEITFVHKHKTHHFLVSPKLSTVDGRDHYTIACDDTEENMAFLIEKWKEFLQPNLCVLFIDKTTGDSWQVCPKTHSLIADEENLEAGLRSLAGRS